MIRPRADTPEDTDARPKVTPDIAAEAAVWVTRLHGPGRSLQMERDFRAWQARSAMHREAFERCTDVWEDVAKIKLATAYETGAAAPSDRPGGRAGLYRWAAAAVVVATLTVGTVAVQHWQGRGEYSTGLGEQRLVLLDDGSRVLMNTDTRLRVSFDAGQRTVSVRGGEAIFEVAKDTLRPFVVRVAGSEVVAVGTAFAVRYADATAGAPGAVAVTLIEGQVSVRRASDVGADAIAPDKAILMQAGERLRLGRAANATAAAPAKVDRPNVDQLTAWKRSEAVFDATALPDAVAEMNRYSRTPIVLVDGLSASELRVSGLYRTGDNAGFARAIASLHGLSLRTGDGRLELGKPH